MTRHADRARAIELRGQGWSIIAIAKELCSAKSSVFNWVRDVPIPEKFTKEFKERSVRLRLSKLAQLRVEHGIGMLKERVTDGHGRWMIRPPNNYEGKRYSNGYIYEHRYLMEQKLGRSLKDGEVVHHINNDPTDNSLENLQLLTRASHDKHHAEQRISQHVLSRVTTACTECKDEFTRSKRLLRGRLHFCSHSCSAKYYSRIRLPNPMKRHIHGTNACYQYSKCRCAECKQAHSDYERTRRRARSGDTL